VLLGIVVCLGLLIVFIIGGIRKALRKKN
jgi:hypothetical protein